MTINWTVVSTLTDIVGALVVVVSLWYVGVQIRQNTRAALATSRQGLLAADLGLITDYITHGIDPHLIGDDVQLSPLDERRFTWIVIKAIRIREFASSPAMPPRWTLRSPWKSCLRLREYKSCAFLSARNNRCGSWWPATR